MQGNILLALAAALMWGGGDFSGGMGVKTVGGSVGGALRIVLMSHLTSFSILLTIALVHGTPFPHGAVLAWGLGSGVIAGLSLTAFYIALSRGAMGASAAVSGLLAAAIPAAVSIIVDGSPGLVKLAGFIVAGAAIWMIAAGPDKPGAGKATGRGTMLLASLAGAGFGIYFVGLKMAGSSGPVWTMAMCRMGSLSICSLMLMGLLLKGGTDKVQVTWTAVRWVLLTALMDTSGNLLFVAATQAGRLDVAAVLASLYPATTILLAAWTLHERPTRRQGLGMLVAAAAVVMITL
ncbi:DMT family transporter [Granulicella arctica]|uniref:Drug/metabolite transporter (DMT)-like permease n=1 Tax=Granulicella arctica TaxID=940613 RepID=A0A7Y9PHH8_9BACT|nr:DMT family transporter [Granulicella arctica]NYF79233.1 drug/metabolite transporter (DMT)-like permease [Granulicella arctica]